jgi:membrane-associated phospholipid phosphatase
MKHRILVAFAATALSAASLPAQSVGRMVVDDVKRAGEDIWSVWLSPFRGDTRDYLMAAAVLGGSAALSTFDDDVDRWAVENRDRGFLKSLKPIRTGGDFYSLNKATPYVAGLYVVALATKHRGLRDGIFGCLAAYTAGTTLRHQVVYRVIGRDRPDTVRNRPEGETGPPAEQGDQYHFSVPADGWRSHSFPGGHVATMATCASFFSNRYDAKYIDPPLIALVAAMGVGRIADRGHWLSDQTVGIAMGYAVGKEVARRQRRRLAAEREGAAAASDRSALMMSPSDQGVVVGWRYTF